MRGLLYKNFFFYRIDMIVIGILQLVVSAGVLVITAMLSHQPEEAMGIAMAFYFCMFFCSGLFEFQMFLPDESRVAGSFIISTPCGVKGHIQSKYYAILIVNLLILFCCFITDTVACGISGDIRYSVGSLCMFFFCMNLVVAAFSTPFIVRFGGNFGNDVKFGVLGVIVLLIGIYALFGDISFFSSDDPKGAILEFISCGNALLVLSLFPCVSVLLYYVSYRLSLVLYRRGVESYEQ